MTIIHVDNIPRTFAQGRTPEAWCETLLELHGIEMSVRNLRSKARRTGNCKPCGRDILILPEQMENLLELEDNTCHSNYINVETHGISKAASTNSRTVDIIEKAQEKLKKATQKSTKQAL